MLKLARAALIYHSIAVHREERMRQELKPDTHIAQMPIDTWEDEWKRGDL